MVIEPTKTEHQQLLDAKAELAATRADFRILESRLRHTQRELTRLSNAISDLRAFLAGKPGD